MRETSTILHRLKIWAHDQPQQPALHYKIEEGVWETLSADRYWHQVVRVALSLVQYGVRRGERIFIYGQNSPEWVQWELGTWLMGAMSVGVHPHTTEHELGLMLEQTQPKLILVESSLYRERLLQAGAVAESILTFPEAVDQILSLKAIGDEELDSRGENLLQALPVGHDCMIIFTSGSTGAPKGVLMGLRQLTYVADALSREWRLPYMDGQLFSFLPLAHIAEKVQTLGVAIVQRYPVWFNSSYEQFFPELREVRPSMLLAVPRVWERFKEQVESQKPKILQRLMELERLGKIAEKVYLTQVKEGLGLDRLKFAVSGAAKLPPAIGEWFNKIGIEIQEIYGMSESCGLITLTRPPRSGFTTVGTPPTGVEIRLAMDGEILVRGPQVFSGYWNGEEATREVLLSEGWLKTGDLGEMNGGLHIIGRNRDIIKLSNGRMVAPLPIENVLKEIPEVSNVCVVGEGKPSLLALITLKENVLVELRFTPGAIEGLTVEDEKTRKRISEQALALLKARKFGDTGIRLVILSRDFSAEQKELTQTQKLNRSRIADLYRHFIDLQYESF
jgi:long-chain acyl-CoA synthetase